MIKVRLSRRPGLASLLVLGTITFMSGCASATLPGYAGEPTSSGEPLIVEGAASDESIRAWAREDVLVITTIGSGSCPLVPALDKVDHDRELITVSTSIPNREGACTADSAPRTFELNGGRDLSGYAVQVTAR